MDDVVEVKPRRGRAAGLVAAGLVAGMVLAGLATADAEVAPAAQPTPTASAEAPPKEKPRDKHGRHHKALRHVLHGEAVVRAPGGGYRTLAMQLGTVTALTPTSVAVRSEDGYARTYARDAETRVADGVAVGDTVRVVAVVEGGNARALHVREKKVRG